MTSIADLEFAEVEVVPALAVQLLNTSGPDPASIGAAMRKSFLAVLEIVNRYALVMNGQPRAVYTAYGPDSVSFICALPVAAGPAEPIDNPHVRVETMPGTKAYRFTHHGPYPDLSRTYGAISALMIEMGLMTTEADWAKYMPMWEEYMNNPETTPAEDLVTYIYLPAVGVGLRANMPPPDPLPSEIG